MCVCVCVILTVCVCVSVILTVCIFYCFCTSNATAIASHWNEHFERQPLSASSDQTVYVQPSIDGCTGTAGQILEQRPAMQRGMVKLLECVGTDRFRETVGLFCLVPK